MTGRTDGTGSTHDGERSVERRLRHALAARAEEITVRDLRPADPPGPRPRRFAGRALGLRRSPWAFAGLSGLTAAAALAGYVLLGPEQLPARPLPPAAPPELTSPGPTPPAESGSPRPGAVPSPVVSSPAKSGPPSSVRPPAPTTRAPSPTPPRSTPQSSAQPSTPPTGSVPRGAVSPSPDGLTKPSSSPTPGT